MVFLFICLIASQLVHADKWAVLIAGSNGYYNYRHQADISHAYTLLTKKGNFKKENVILMMYDDVAHSSQNPDPGTLINKPGGNNVYPGREAVDYRYERCTAANVLKVLNGTASGKVLGSGPDDLVFFYFADHGAPGLVAMPAGDPLYADDLLKTFSWMEQNGKFKEMAVYIEACESGSMLSNLPANIKIYGTTAATPNESSYATYWDDDLQTYLGDEYSVAWMEDSEKNWDADIETLWGQFMHVKKHVNHSHPQMYGDKRKKIEKVRHFQDESEARRNLDTPKKQRILFSDSHDVVLNTLENRARLATTPLEYLIERKLIEKEIASRNSFDTIFKTLAMSLIKNDDIDTFISHVVDDINFECLKVLHQHFQNKCMKWTDYGMKYITAFVNLCDQEDTGTIKDETTKICNNYFGRGNLSRQ